MAVAETVVAETRAPPHKGSGRRSSAPFATSSASQRRRAIPLAIRLTGILALLLAGGLCIVAALAVQRVRAHLEHDLDDRLQAVAESFQDGPAPAVGRPADVAPVAREWMQRLPQPSDQVVIIRTTDGQVMSTRSELNFRELPGSDDLLLAHEAGWHTLDAGPIRVRALTVPLLYNGTMQGTLLVAASTDSIESTATALLRQILLAAAVGFFLVAALVAVAVRRSLRPLGRMSTEIATIQAGGDLSRRVYADGPADEVGRVASAFNEMLERLEEAFQSQRQFIADASHELRTPLTVVRGQLELLNDRLHGRPDRTPAALAVDEVDRMSRIVDDLLLLARLDEGLPVTAEPVEVELVVQEAVLRQGAAAGRIDVDVAPGTVARADTDRLLQVLTNVVTNALRHGGEETRVRVRGHGVDTLVRIDIEDDGPGILPEELPHVFDRFYRGTTSRAAGGTGSGLGLSIVRSLVERMAGGVDVTSLSGLGTTVSISLPRA